MKDYYVKLKQRGQGCDYTIDCGTTVYFLGSFSSMKEAEKELLLDKGFCFDPEGDCTAHYLDNSSGNSYLSEATIFECSKVLNIDLKALAANINKQKEEIEKSEQEKEERKLLEKLKKKYDR